MANEKNNSLNAMAIIAIGISLLLLNRFMKNDKTGASDILNGSDPLIEAGQNHYHEKVVPVRIVEQDPLLFPADMLVETTGEGAGIYAGPWGQLNPSNEIDYYN